MSVTEIRIRYPTFYQTVKAKAADKAKVQATDKEQDAEAAQVPAAVQDLVAESATATGTAQVPVVGLAEIELRRRRHQCQKV